MDDICFKIGERILYIEQELVRFNIPIFFVCKDSDNNRYSVLCVDSDVPRYIVVMSDTKDLLQMLKSQLKIRELLLKSEKAWSICAKDDYNEDIIYEIPTTSLNDAELPQKDAFFELRTNDIEKYILLLDEEASNITITTITSNIAILYNLKKVSNYSYRVNSRLIDKNNYLDKDVLEKTINLQLKKYSYTIS